MANHTTSIRVVKIGGSLLDKQASPSQISEWIAKQPLRPTIWIVGGGKLVNALREWNERFPIDDYTAHWMAIELMDFNARLVATWFPDWTVTTKFSLEGVGKAHTTAIEATNQLFLCSEWLKQNKKLLPLSWNVTSDSIAATIAREVNASELVLLKSCDAPSEATIETLASQAIIDQHFPSVMKTQSSELEFRIVNLGVT